jgi:hypothetical protein
MAVDADDMPAIGFEARGILSSVNQPDVTVDGNAVVVVEAGQLTQPQVPASEQASWLMPSIRQPSPRKTQVR